MTHLKIFVSVLAMCLTFSNSFCERNIFKFQQNDYKIQFERLIMDHYSEKYIKYAKVATFKYNRTSPVVNATFIAKVAMEYDLQVIVQVYKFLSNEYRLFPIRFEVNLCDALSTNLIGVRKSFKCGNFTGCPIKGNLWYHICNWSIDESEFPPLIPDGNYRIDLNAIFHGEDVGMLNVFVKIYRPISIPQS